MQRLLFALMTALSLLFVNPGTTHAQSGAAVEPSRNPQTVDEPVETSHSNVAFENAHAADAVVIGPDQTIRDVSVNGRRLMVQGHVTHDVMAINSQVTIAQTATVDGKVTVVGGSIENLAGDRVHVDHRQNPVFTGRLKSASLPGQTSIIELSADVQPASQPHNWFGAQFALLLLGLLGGLTMSLLIPRPTQRVAEQMALHPKRSLCIGGISAAMMLTVLMVDAFLLHVPGVRFIGILIAVAPLLLLGFGWLSGMRYAGDVIARKLNRPREGNPFGRIALGLGTFFLANIFLGSMSEGLGVLCFGAELLVALMGLGATVVIAAGKSGRQRA